VQSGVATALGAVIARTVGWDWSAGLIFGMALSVASTVVLRPRRQQRPAHAGRPHRRRLARCRGSLHRARAGAVAGALRLDRAADLPVDRPRLDRGQGIRPRGIHRRRRHVADPAHAGLRRADAIPGAVHADGAGGRPGDRRRFGVDLQRLDGPGGFPGGNGRRPIRVQPSGGIRSAADARRVCGALLRVGRDAAGSGCPLANPDPGCRRADRGPGREASGRAVHCLGLGLSTEGRPHRRDRTVPNRRVLVHPSRAWEGTRRAARRGDQRHRGSGDRVDRVESVAVQSDWTYRTVDWRETILAPPDGSRSTARD
jgi:hypothetical protein